jgi:DNA-binding GntR family transcriptional regulator
VSRAIGDDADAETSPTGGRTLSTKPDDPRTWTTRDHRAYASLFAMLRDRINANYYTPGKRIPSIAELGIETGLSRQTVGRALRFLESEGLAVRAAGLGYFVTDPDD